MIAATTTRLTVTSVTKRFIRDRYLLFPARSPPERIAPIVAKAARMAPLPRTPNTRRSENFPSRNCLKYSQRASRLCVVGGTQRLNKASLPLIYRLDSQRTSLGAYPNFQTVSLGRWVNKGKREAPRLLVRTCS